MNQEKGRLLQENDRLFQENDKLNQEKGQLTQNMKMLEDRLNGTISKLEKRIQELQTKGTDRPNTKCCPPRWQTYRSSCYQLSSTTNTWYYAYRDCQSKGAHLVTDNNALKKRFVHAFGYRHEMWVDTPTTRFHDCYCPSVDASHTSLVLHDCYEHKYWMCKKN
ncbi:C-type lectin domain family 12 member B-like [Larimichthys crocea]|uniref:C-type lectin domain family 12 member B-like n=1 Tax=Larimichthys crocea TaxID=215358 RepID=UPI000F5F01CE|nr:C-type lectin domain family 12 member B-like [Larimichthys crocea]